MYVYTDEDNAPMNDFDFHNPTVYPDQYTARMYDGHGEPEPKCKPEDGCWNCLEYNPSKCACMLRWNNLDKSYFNPDLDGLEPTDKCDEHKTDPDAVWEDFGGNEP